MVPMATTIPHEKRKTPLASILRGFLLGVLPGSSFRLGLVLQHIKEGQGPLGRRSLIQVRARLANSSLACGDAEVWSRTQASAC